MKIKLSDYVASYLVSKAKYVFSVTGAGSMHCDSIGTKKGLRVIYTHHNNLRQWQQRE